MSDNELKIDIEAIKRRHASVQTFTREDLKDDARNKTCNYETVLSESVDDVPVLLDLIRELEAENERLRAVVSKLPTTADGAPIVSGMTVHKAYKADSWSLKVLGYQKAYSCRPDKDDMDATRCYSTRAAALAASAAQPSPQASPFTGKAGA